VPKRVATLRTSAPERWRTTQVVPASPTCLHRLLRKASPKPANASRQRGDRRKSRPRRVERNSGAIVRRWRHREEYRVARRAHRHQAHAWNPYARRTRSRQQDRDDTRAGSLAHGKKDEGDKGMLRAAGTWGIPSYNLWNSEASQRNRMRRFQRDAPPHTPSDRSRTRGENLRDISVPPRSAGVPTDCTRTRSHHSAVGDGDSNQEAPRRASRSRSSRPLPAASNP
jgi:hypothetical protein